MRAGNLMTTAGPGRLLIGGAVILVICALLVRVIDRVTVRADEDGRASPMSRSARKADSR